MNYYYLKKIIFIVVYITISLLLTASPDNQECLAWWFHKSDKQLLQDALKSENPKKVERCLNKLVKKNNLSGIIQIRHHARKMIRAEKNRLLQKGALSLNESKTNLAPWIRIEKKATQYFQRKK